MLSYRSHSSHCLLLWDSEVCMLKRTNQLHKKSYFLYSDFSIITPNVYVFFPLRFSTLNTSHHTPFLYASIFSPLRSAAPLFCRNKTKTLLYTVLYTEAVSVTVQLNNSVAALCWQWGSPTHRTQYMAARTQSRTLNTYNYRTNRYLCCAFFHWHSNTNRIPITDG